MSLGLLARLDDRLNPIVVKELRQAVQSKFVVAVLLLFLFVQLTIIGIYLVASEAATSLDVEAGRTIFNILQGILLGTCMLFIPAYTGLRLAAERSDVNVDLLFVTTLRPRAIIWGKFLAGFILAMLIFSACAPFMTFTYLLRGIDVPSILCVLAIDFLAVLVAVQLVIFVAVIPANRVFKSVLGMLCFVALTYLFVGTLAGTLMVVEFGIASFMDRLEFWASAVSAALTVLAESALFFSWSVAIISPPSANRALLVRLFMLGVWLISGAAFVLWSRLLNHPAPLYVWILYAGTMFALGMIIAVNERERWGPRVARTIPRHWWLRIPAFLVYSGAAGGIVFSVLMLGLTCLAVKLWHPEFVLAGGTESLDMTLKITIIIAIYIYAYALTAVLVRRLFPRQIKALYTWVVLTFLLAIGSVVPFLISYLLMFRNWQYESHFYFLLGNPIAAVLEIATTRAGYGHEAVFFAFSLCWATLVTLLNIPWFIKQVEHFRPPDKNRVSTVIPVVVAEPDPTQAPG